MALLRGLVWLLDTVVERAERTLHDGDAVKAQLAELYSRHEAGTVGEAEFTSREAELVQRLAEIEEYEEQRAQRGPR
jgi:Gas vesicle protein G